MVAFVAASVVALAAPAHAAPVASDGCSLGSPNIVRDVTDCVATITEGCSLLGSPNIVRDVTDCLSNVIGP
jgi:hypothetical protein